MLMLIEREQDEIKNVIANKAPPIGGAFTILQIKQNISER